MKLLVTFAFVALFAISSNGFKIQPRVHNGIESDPTNYPFYVHVRQFDGDNVYECGGSLLNDR